MTARAPRLAWRALLRFFDHSGPDRAAAVAYYALLSLLPLLMFLISVGAAVLGSFDAAYQGALVLFRGVVAHMDASSLEALRTFVERARRFQWPSLILLAWTSKRIFASLFSALEAVFEVPARGFARGNLLALGMVMVTGVGLLATMALTTALATAQGLVLRLAGPGEAQWLGGLGALFLTYGLPAVITASFFFILYRVAPRRAASSAQAAAGALLATALWEAAKAGFAYYVRSLAHYAGVYGTLEGVIVLALWLELSVSIILYCGEVVALMLKGPEASPPSSPSSAPLTGTAGGE